MVIFHELPHFFLNYDEEVVFYDLEKLLVQTSPTPLTNME